MLSEIGFASGFELALITLELFGLIVVFVEIVLSQRIFIFIMRDKVAFVTFVHLICHVNLLMNLQGAEKGIKGERRHFSHIFTSEPCLSLSI